ncbi:MAG: ABC transporter substrate-binding protein [Saprospiraceae bacterium]
MKVNVLAGYILILVISSCRNDQHQIGSVFHYNQPNLVTSLDPAFARTQNNYWVVDHLYSQLLDLDDSLSIVPELASRYNVSSDGLTYTFILRQNVYFHPDSCFGRQLTRKVNADDVKYSFMRLLDPGLNAPGRWIFLGRLDSLMPFESRDDSTLIIHLKKPFSPFLSLLTMHYCSIVAKEAVEFYKSSFGHIAVGTGPFRLKKWSGQQGMFLVKNENYFKPGLPKLDGVRISFIEDRNTAYLEFLMQRIDFFNGIQPSFALQLLNRNGTLRKDKAGKMIFQNGPFLNTEYIGINVSQLKQNHPLRQKKFRQALNYAIDRKKIIEYFRYGIGTPANSGFIPNGLRAFNPEAVPGYSYDPLKAKQLMKECNYNALQNNTESAELVLYTNKDYVDLMTFIARQWQEIGIAVKIELLETATLREKMRNGEISLFRGSWIADYPNEESFLTFFYGKNPVPPNYTRFSNQAYDLGYEKLIQHQTDTSNFDLCQSMDRILIDECPVVFLFYDQTAWFSQSNITGLRPNALNLLKLDSVDKVEDK